MSRSILEIDEARASGRVGCLNMRRLAPGLLLALWCTFSAPAAIGQSADQSHDNSLAEIARSQPKKKAQRVITDDDLPGSVQRQPHPTAATEPLGNHESESASPEISTAPNSSSGANVPEGLDPGTPKPDPALVQKLKQEEETLRRHYDEMRRKLSETKDESLQRLYSECLAKRDETLARKRKQIDEAGKSLHLVSDDRGGQGGTGHATH